MSVQRFLRLLNHTQLLRGHQCYSQSQATILQLLPRSFSADVAPPQKPSRTRNPPVTQTKPDSNDSKSSSVNKSSQTIANLKSTSTNKPTTVDSGKSPQLDKLYKTIEVEVLAYEPAVLDSYQWFVLTAAHHLELDVGKCWSPPLSDKYRFPALKSAFVHKKHQVHYEIRTYHRFFTFHKLTGSTADTFLEYIQRNLPEGVGMKVTKVEVQPMPDYVSC